MKSTVYWIPNAGRGRLGIAARPRGGDWLAGEVAAWRSVGVHTVVSLLTPEENAELGLDEEAAACAELGLHHHSLPVEDRGLPVSRAATSRLVEALHRDLEAGRTVLVHCRQGIGRASLIAASVLIAQGEDPDHALESIEAARGRPVPDTPEQASWVRAFRAA